MSTYDLVALATIVGLGGGITLLVIRLAQLWVEPALTDAGYRALRNVFLGLCGLAAVVSLAIMLRMIDAQAHTNAQQAGELRRLRQQTQQACREGALKTTLVAVGLQYHDVDAIDRVHQLLFYGEPWLRLCGVTSSAAALQVNDAAQLGRMLQDIQQQLP